MRSAVDSSTKASGVKSFTGLATSTTCMPESLASCNAFAIRGIDCVSVESDALSELDAFADSDVSVDSDASVEPASSEPVLSVAVPLVWLT